MAEHGGKLRAAARTQGIALERWLDLSTGISPWPWPAPAIPSRVWQRLPEADDSLSDAAASAFGGGEWLPMPGSQAAIQQLPAVLGAHRIACRRGSYAEHAAAWRAAGAAVTEHADDADLQAAADDADALVIVNPDNPSGRHLDAPVLLALHRRLARRGGWLIVDEAFADADPSSSLAPLAGRPGLVVLRSLGKFYGLAGLRLGFLGSPAAVRSAIAERLGPWAVNHPARWIARRALADRRWQRRQRRRLAAASARLDGRLDHHGLRPAGGTTLFSYVPHPRARGLARRFARQAVLVRAFDTPPALRFGLPGARRDWQHLERALKEVM